jgi:hypothetical protein
MLSLLKEDKNQERIDAAESWFLGMVLSYYTGSGYLTSSINIVLLGLVT